MAKRTARRTARRTNTASRCRRCNGGEHDTDAGNRNCRARTIAAADPGAALEAAQSDAGVALLAAAGAPDALLMTLIQTRVPPEAWISAQAWERDPKGVQGAIMRLRMPTGPVSVILRAGDPKWAWGLRQAKEPSPEGLYEAEPEAGDGRPLGDVIAEWLNEIAVNADGLSALAAVVEDAGLPEPVAPDAVLHPHAGILPSAIAGSAVLMRVRNSVDKLPKLPGEVGGDGGDGWLPRLDPGVGSLLRHPIIEILHAGGLPAFPRRSGAPWALRIRVRGAARRSVQRARLARRRRGGARVPDAW